MSAQLTLTGGSVGFRVDALYLERLDHILMATHLAFKAVCAEQRTS